MNTEIRNLKAEIKEIKVAADKELEKKNRKRSF